MVSLKRLGIIPEKMDAELNILGNSSLKGLRKIMLEKDIRKKLRKLAREIKTIELSAHREFKQEFLNQLNFP